MAGLDVAVREYLTRLHALLDQERTPGWAVLNAMVSLTSVLKTDAAVGRVDWEGEADYLEARLGEARKAHHPNPEEQQP